MEQQLILPETPPDAAAQAFTELRQEIAFMRRAMEKFTDEHPKIEIPDYTSTLSDIRVFLKSQASSLKTLSETPNLSLTPDQIAFQITERNTKARAAEQAALREATSENAKLTRELSRYLQQAETAHRQNQWVAGAMAAGFALGCAVVGVIWFLMSDPGDPKPVQAVEQHQPTKAKKR